MLRSHHIYRAKVKNHEGRLTYSYLVAAFTKTEAEKKVIAEVNELGSIGPQFSVEITQRKDVIFV